MAIQFSKDVHLSAGQRIAMTFPSVPASEWHGYSEIHRSHAAFVSYNLMFGNRPRTKQMAMGECVRDALKFLTKLTPKLTWLVSPQEFVQLYLATVNLPYEQTQKTKTHTKVNPESGNVYVPVARCGDIMVLLRSWSEKEQQEPSVNYRVRFVVVPVVMQEAMIEQTDSALHLSAKEHAKEADQLVEKATVKERESIFDFTPEERVGKKRVRVTEGNGDY